MNSDLEGGLRRIFKRFNNEGGLSVALLGLVYMSMPEVVRLVRTITFLFVSRPLHSLHFAEK
jgi:hypothetical protein